MTFKLADFDISQGGFKSETLTMKPLQIISEEYGGTRHYMCPELYQDIYQKSQLEIEALTLMKNG